MKKFFAGFFCALILMVGVHAASTIEAILSPETNIKLKGQILEMRDANTNRVYPINYNGTVYLPVRAISQNLGLFVDYDATTKTVILDDKPIGADKFYKPGEVWEMPGEWKMTVTSAEFTKERNEFEKVQPNEVAFIRINYENIGYENIVGLKFEPELEAKTSDGKVVKRYGATVKNEKGQWIFPAYIKKGEKLKDAIWAFGVDSKDVESVRVTFKQKDNSGKVHTADFVVPIKK